MESLWFPDLVSHDGAEGSWLELCQVYTSYPADAVLGHVLIPSLSPYVSSSRPGFWVVRVC